MRAPLAQKAAEFALLPARNRLVIVSEEGTV